MGSVILDISGKMREDCFFRLTFLEDEELLQLLHGNRLKDPGAQVSRRNPTQFELLRAGKEGYARVLLEWFEDFALDKVRGCPVDAGHVLQEHEIRPKLRPFPVGKVPDISVASLEMNDISSVRTPFCRNSERRL